MDIIKKIYKEELFLSKLFKEYLNGLRCAFFDIETTGINANKNKVILMGIMIVDHKEMTVHQVFADTKKEEAQLLEHTVSLLQDIDVIFNYNASAFDIPFVNKRLSVHGIDYQIPKYKSFDLYKIIKKYGYNILADYKLKTVEQYMGIQRTDDLSGKDCVDSYNLYEKNKDLQLKEKILLHNLEDIYYLSKIFPLLNKYDIHRIMFENHRYVTKDIIITQSKIKKHELTVQGITYGLPQDYTAYGQAFSFIYDQRTQQFNLSIQLYKKETIFFISLSDFEMPYRKRISQPYVSDDYIIVKQDEAINYAEINSFINVLILHLGLSEAV